MGHVPFLLSKAEVLLIPRGRNPDQLPRRNHQEKRQEKKSQLCSAQAKEIHREVSEPRRARPRTEARIGKVAVGGERA
eukprot:s420_g8.t1